MKVLHVIASVDPASGGPIEGVIRAAEASRRLGYERHIVTLDSPDDPCVAACPGTVIPLGVPGHYRNMWRNWIPWMRYRYSPRLTPWLSQNASNYDAVIVNGVWNYAALGTWRALSGGTVPYFVFTHGMLDPWFRKTYPLKHAVKQFFWWISEGHVLRDARSVLFTSEEERRLARGEFWPYAAHEEVIAYGTADPPQNLETQIAAFCSKAPALENRKYILFLGRLHPKKGCDLLIRAFGQIADRHQDIDLAIAGPDQNGWRSKLERMAHGIGISNRIHWLGMLTGDAKWGAFRRCEAFILPSHSENFGIVVSEALACSKPVLITRKVNIWREIVAAGAGLVCDDNESDVCDMVERFLQLPEQARVALGQNARACFLTNYEADNVARRFLQLLESHLMNRSSAISGKALTT